MSTYRQYLKTLRRVPDDIVLAVATREIRPMTAESCLCGWVVRESVARMASMDAERIDPYDHTNGHGVVGTCTERFGGKREEWASLFSGIVYDADVERAFVERVMECVP